jgi:organic radical activating enzyme
MPARGRSRGADDRAGPPPARGPEIDGRPAPTGERTFRPNYVSFSGTYRCNLSCAHCCVPIEWEDRLPIPAALRFLESAFEVGIRIVGFTGGEPFLYPEFLNALARRAAGLGMRFDRIMTNGAWWETVEGLESVLADLYGAGFSGRIGLSVDKFHPVRTEVLAAFCKAVRRVSGRDDAISLSYASRSRERGLERIRALAEALSGVIEWSPLLGTYMVVTPDLSMTLAWNHLAPVERAERLGGGWDGRWFREDFCEGPGQALIVTAKGEVKPCCGFASDLDQLTIGHIERDTAADAIERARRHPYVGKVFREGLSKVRDEILARDPAALPGATSNHCFFCWYVLTRGLVEGLPGGGGQIGNWVGLRKLPVV